MDNLYAGLLAAKLPSGVVSSKLFKQVASHKN
jgi:hypothetical protein